jgi:hypothetical protein
MADYVFKLKKGELELELRSDDPAFVQQQMEQWRNQLLQPQGTAAATPTRQPEKTTG